MKLKIELFSDKPVVFPRGYNEYLQAMIYNNIDKEQAQWLHDKGYAYEKRSFKLFVFSDIIVFTLPMRY